MPQKRRQYRPFEEARLEVRGLGFRNQKAYEEWSKSGARPDDIPGSPRKAYADHWSGWADFLGNGGPQPNRLCQSGEYLAFEEARAIVRKRRLPTQKAYQDWAKSSDRPQGIPAGPYTIYRQYWISWADWLGTRGADGYRPFGQARDYARSKGFTSRKQWSVHTESLEFPFDLPVYPEHAYRDSGWVDWPDWLGIKGKLTRPRILSILNAIRGLIHDLSPAELFVILRHRGVLSADSRHTRIDAIQALERICQTDNIEACVQDVLSALDRGNDPNSEVSAEVVEVSSKAMTDQATHELSPAEIEETTAIRRINSIDSLRVIDKALKSGLIDAEEELTEFLVSSRIAALWQETFDNNPEFTPDRLAAAEPGHFYDVIRQRFLTEYNATLNLPLPDGYSFFKNGVLTPPNLMQKLTAYRLKTTKRVINASGVGAGKTLSAINASQVVNAKLTIIIGVNATIANLDEVIQSAFPNAVRIRKERGPYVIDPDRPTFIILNFESFQQNSWSDEMLADLLSHKIDMIVVDEIQSVRLREGNEESNRRRRVRLLIENAASQNPGLSVLGMSATPVVNDLHEAKTLLELVTGQDLGHLPTRPTVPNAILYYQLLTKHGLRYRPNYPQSIETFTPRIDGRGILSQLRKIKPRDVLAMEQVLLQAKLPTIRAEVKPGTIIYTPFVTEIINPLADCVSSAGLKSGLFTGEDKSGYEKFLAGEVDVLIGSEPIGTGIDKLQEVGNRLIFVSLPWTSSQYDQVVGRLHRQGMLFDKVEVLIPIVELLQGDSKWSWDQRRLDRIRFKRTLADAAVDGVIPEGKLPSQQEMQEHSLNALHEWISQVQKEGPNQMSSGTDPTPINPTNAEDSEHA